MIKNDETKAISNSKDLFFISLEIKTRYEKRKEQKELKLPIGEVPTVKTISELILQEYQFETAIPHSLNPISFKPLNWEKTDIMEIVVIRVAKDYTYRPITKL
jgi:hypothetical protein